MIKKKNMLNKNKDRININELIPVWNFKMEIM